MILAGLNPFASSVASAATDPCSVGTPVACENSKPGTSPSEWDIQGSGDDAIQGFATTTSVQPGQTVQFKIKASASYTVDVYRLGYYQGLGARRQAPTWTVSNPAAQPACVSDTSTQNYDCGTWGVSTQWAVPSNAVSGVYIVKLTMGDDVSQIPFVVRDDSTSSAVLFKTSDATWQAYNTYGGADYYTAPNGLTQSQARAFKISYNRPYATRGDNDGRDYLFSNEYPTLRFLERNGIDVSYTTDVDVSNGSSSLTSHKVFMSVGHDEYWTKSERDNVEAARDAGVNMMFLSGNEVYWHTRLAPSIDGSNTPDRTIVCYKDSWEPAKIDPGEGSPTWRDASQAAPNGSRPENSLTGTMYMSNYTDLAIDVSAAQGKTRLWRNTSLATMAAGSTASLLPHSIGYESDEDVDNGSRPAGLMRLSETTGATGQKVQNQAGTQVAAGTTTHSLTLYRAASGALVFGAGTINWGWGLDATHDGDTSGGVDSRMQQATLNMLADMGVLPTTLMSGMVMPAASTDTAAPTVTVTSPTSNTALANGSAVTVTGTATDNGGGVVTTVEVSLDGGKTYHRATGTTSWTYSGVISGIGSGAIKVRANDDSANLSTPVSVGVNVACPCSLFGQQTPAVAATSDTSAVELGVKFTADSDGFISGIRFFKGNGNSGTHMGTLWTSSGQALAAGTFSNESATGWQTLTFENPVSVTAGVTYVASYYAPNGHYAADNNFFSYADYHAAPLNAPGAPSSVTNGVYGSGHGFPTSSYQGTNYWVDVLYNRDNTTPPSVSRTSPVTGATSVATTATVTATFAATVDPSTVTIGLTDAQGNSVPGTMSFDASTRVARFVPSAPLGHGASYTASVSASSGSGVPMAAPYTWSFTVSAVDPLPGACPCSIWPDSATPDTPSSSDNGSLELGVKWTADVDGQVTGVRFYKGTLNLGTHTGTLWTATGTQLATVTFTGESSTGWQTAYFTSPVDVTAGTTYIVSYHAPNGGYAVTSGGLTTGVDSPPLHALAGTGLYTYGSGAPLNATNNNYWVDLVFMATDAAPSVASTSPGASATNVNVAATVSATMSGKVQNGTAKLAVSDAGGNPVAGTTSWSAASNTITFTPGAALATGASYTATVSGATALSGNLMSPYSFTFTTAGAGACPCTLFDSSAVPSTVDSGDGGSVELGVSFSPSMDGQITGLRFYKSALNTGTHSGSLWDASGNLLASGTFTGESASGWQYLSFDSPVAVSANQNYVVSYHAPNGHYSATGQFFASAYSNGPLTAGTGNGLYSYSSSRVFPTSSYGATNYWVDPIFKTGTPPDITAPTVKSAAPLDGATSQPVASTPSATFSEPIDPSTLTFSVATSGGTAVTGTASYDGTSRTATFTPASNLSRGTKYSVSVRASDVAGNAMSAATTWSFTTAQPDPTIGSCPCSLWTDATQPTSMTDPDSVAVELGTAFSTDTSGVITGVRFYKGPQNTGTHTVSLWTTDGTRLSTAVASSESSTGWQTVSFASPVAVSAGTTYVVSYNAPNGKYSSVAGGLSSALDVGPLHTVAAAGRYLYNSGYPSNSSNASYLVDPVFNPSVAQDTTPPVISTVKVTPSATSATVTWSTDESSTSVVAYGTSAGSLTSTATGASGTSHSVALTGLASGTTYYYQVTSVDPSGNSATSPSAAASFGTTDVTPPVISAVSAAGSGTSATVTWTTDETSTSVVAYGTSATALTSTANGGSGTSHSVTLSGLTANTRYYYRVTSVDPSGNSATSPTTNAAAAQYTPTVTPFTATSVSDFSTGSGGYVSDTSGGEIIATPAAGFEFAGTALPTGLASTALATGGTTVVANKAATISGSQLAVTQTSGTGISFTAAATMQAGHIVALGSTNGGASGVRAAFVVTSAGAMTAVVNDGLFNQKTIAITGSFSGISHVYRIDWSNRAVTFFIDGVQVATNGFVPIGASLKPMLIDPVVDTQPLVVDWLRTGPYAASSTWVSKVIDAGAGVTWDTLTRDVTTATGTTVTIQVRTGATATPDSSWTAWSTVSATTGSIAKTSRYLQYQVVSTTSGTRFVSPETRSVQVSFHVP